MSQATIARWNSIPLEPTDAPNLKRSRPDDRTEADDDDDVSIVSRSPSPAPDNKQADHDIYEYDKYARGEPREVITVDTKIKPSNKGFAMLAKLGWVDGQPLGISGEGRVEPIPFMPKNDLTGLGKTSQDFRMIETTVSTRRNLDSERQQKETEEQRRLREDAAARKFALADEISSTLKAFYCTLCDKQFQNVAQYDEHTNSYAHHHKARAKDMQANIRIKPLEEIEKRKEKERKREEKELRKLAAAQGIKIPKPTAPPINSEAPVKDQLGPSKGGWASVSAPSASNSTGISGWATTSSLVTQPFVPAVTPGPAPTLLLPEDSAEDMDVDGTPLPEPISNPSGQAPLQANSETRSQGLGGFSDNLSPTRWHTLSSSSSTSRANVIPQPTRSTVADSSPPPPIDFKFSARPSVAPTTEPAAPQESSRSSWQKFQKAGRRR